MCKCPVVGAVSLHEIKYVKVFKLNKYSFNKSYF